MSLNVFVWGVCKHVTSTVSTTGSTLVSIMAAYIPPQSDKNKKQEALSKNQTTVFVPL